MVVIVQGREKIGLVLAFTSMGFDVLVSDVDTVWMRNPMPYMAAYPEAAILVSSDSLVCSCLYEDTQKCCLSRSAAFV